MPGNILGLARKRCSDWCRQHPKLAVGALLLLAALLIGAGFRVADAWAERSQLLAAQQSMSRGEWSEAYVQLSVLLKERPDSGDAHLFSARAARRLQRLDEAADHLSASERLGANPRACQLERALLRLQQGDLAGTEAFLRESVSQNDPDAVEVLDVLSIALVLEHRLPEAHRCLEDLLRREPGHFEGLLRHAATAERQGWNEVAVQSLEKALKIRPQNQGTRLLLGQNLVALGRFAEAQVHLTQLLQEEPENPAVIFALARCLAWDGRKAQAAAMLDRLLLREPDNWTILGERGTLCLEMDRPAEAEAYLRLAQTLAPPNQALLTHLADCLRLLGKQDEAKPYRDQAVRLQEDTVRAALLEKRLREERPIVPAQCHELAGILTHLGREDDAIFYLRKALQINPNYLPAHESLAALYTKAGAVEQAAFHKRKLGMQR